jgi:cobalt-zinc-cadmium efflux system protein
MSSNRLLDHDPRPHDHPDHPEKPLREEGFNRLIIALVVCSGVMALEMLGGLWSGSLALVADATHMLADTVALGMAILAAWLAVRPKSKYRSYGYYRLEVLAAFLNGILLLGIAGFLTFEAIDRWSDPHSIQSSWMLGIGIIGLVANLAMMKLMHETHEANINLKAAFLHVIGDALSSLAVIFGAVIIMFTGAYWPDLAASFVVSLMITIMAVRLIYSSGHVLLEGAPRHMDPEELESELFKKFPQIRNIHDLHIWEITSHLFAMTAHFEADIKNLEDSQILIDHINAFVREKYGVGHTTFQVEPFASTN